jgi:hypothetical protein
VGEKRGKVIPEFGCFKVDFRAEICDIQKVREEGKNCFLAFQSTTPFSNENYNQAEGFMMQHLGTLIVTSDA